MDNNKKQKLKETAKRIGMSFDVLVSIDYDLIQDYVKQGYSEDIMTCECCGRSEHMDSMNFDGADLLFCTDEYCQEVFNKTEKQVKSI